MTSPAPDLPKRVTLVLGTTAGGTGAHVAMLAAGLARRGIAVSVAGPSSAGLRFSFPVPFTGVEIGNRPRAGDLAAAARLRRLLVQRGPGRPGRGDVVHAHGMRAGALTALALLLVPGARRPRVVVTVHNAPPGGGTAGRIHRLLEFTVARRADLVLCVSGDLERRMRDAGARRVGRAVVAAPDGPPAPGAGPAGGNRSAGAGGDGRPAAGRPVVLAAGRLAAQKGFGTLVEAAVSWRGLDPEPLVMIAGDGPLAGQLRDRADALGVNVAFLGHVADVPARLAAAAVFVLPSQWEGQPLVLQEALRAGVPVVATRVGGIPDLTGEDAALLVPPEDPRTLASAVRSVLTDAPLAARLRAAAAARAASLPSEADATDAALSAYASLGRPPALP